MARYVYNCIDGHTCGNPVRLVTDGHPPLEGATQSERRQHFMAEYDWIRTGLMFEPRGHDMMSGAFLYPATREDCDIAILFIETSGCLPMCGHGTIGVVTMAIEHKLVTPRTPGVLNLDTPAGPVVAHYTQVGDKVTAVRITNVPSFLYARDLEVEHPVLGKLKLDIAYGGNFYPILEPQENYRDMAELEPAELIRYGRELIALLNQRYDIVHPEDPSIRGLRHFQWTGRPRHPQAHARNAVIYGKAAIDRSPCGTGTSARMAQLHGKGLLQVGDEFVHESIIGSLFRGRVEAQTRVGAHPAIIPSIEGWARTTGYNQIILDEDDPYMRGFQVV
ncbi:MAG TPA: 4-hydroxyproline epimerase [Candidatus Competibacteraceae bacterium]|nr:4-hydroxyproline epimerase [Candidatus Competibacteraceae bacterium]